LPAVDRVVAEMHRAGMMREIETEGAGQRLQATRLGRVAVRHLLAPATLILFRRFLERQTEPTFFDLLLLASSACDCEPVVAVDFEGLEEMAAVLAAESSTLLSLAPPELTNLLGIGGRRLLAALNTAVVIRAWTRTGDAEKVATAAGWYAFEVKRVVESVERLLLAMGAVLDAPEEETRNRNGVAVSLPERIRVLRRMVSAGLDERAATLTTVPGIGPTLAKRLVAQGIANVEELAQTTTAELAAVPGVSGKRAADWIACAHEVVVTTSATRYREAEVVPRNRAITLTGTESSAVQGSGTIDPYRLRRAMELTVRSIGRGIYHVQGGLDPHVVRLTSHGQFVCDCPDSAAGHTCKHRLAVQRKRHDPEVGGWLRRVRASERTLDLTALWFAR
jgi:helicase